MNPKADWRCFTKKEAIAEIGRIVEVKGGELIGYQDGKAIRLRGGTKGEVIGVKYCSEFGGYLEQWRVIVRFERLEVPDTCEVTFVKSLYEGHLHRYPKKNRKRRVLHA